MFWRIYIFIVFLGVIAVGSLYFGHKYFYRDTHNKVGVTIEPVVIENGPVIENEYGWYWKITDDRLDKTEPLRIFGKDNPSKALHSADIKINFNEQSREFTLQEFVDLIFGKQTGSLPMAH